MTVERRSLRIDITQDIIDRTIRENSHHDVIAEAIRTQVPEARYVKVDLYSTRYIDRKEGVRYAWVTPPRAQKLLIAFDVGMPIEPQTIRFSTVLVTPLGAADDD